MVGHAALHAAYIATWQRRHARRVVAMSAMGSFAARMRLFGSAEVAWYLLGTSFDIGVHVAMCCVLACALVLLALS